MQDVLISAYEMLAFIGAVLTCVGLGGILITFWKLRDK